MGSVCPCFAGVEKAAGDTGRKPPASAADHAHANEQTIIPESRAHAQPAPTSGGVDVGMFLDVYSNSYERWCPGVVQKFEGSLISVAYQTPGESPAVPNINIKTLPADTPELRQPKEEGPCIGAVVEVFARNAWCPGVIQSLKDATAAVAFFYPDVPPGAEPSIINLALGHQDLRLFGADGAAQAIAAQYDAGTDAIGLGTAVEVFSTSMNEWLAGTVTDRRDGMVIVSFYYPDMDQTTEAPVTKELPFGHQDLRICGGDRHDTKMYDIGRPAEVWSESRGQWLLGQITDRNQMGEVTVQFKYPDMPPESDFYTKVLLIGDPYLRPHATS